MSLKFLLNHSQEDLEDSGAAAARYLSGGSQSPGPRATTATAASKTPYRPQTAESRCSPNGARRSPSTPASPATTLLGKRKVAAREDESGTESQSHSPGSECTAWSSQTHHHHAPLPAREPPADGITDGPRRQKSTSSGRHHISLMPKADEAAAGMSYEPSSAPRVASGNSPQTVCYGMLHRVDLKLLGDLTETSRHLDSLSLPDGVITLGLSEQSDHVLVSFADKTPLGYLRSHMKDALGPLLQHQDIEFDVVVEASYLQDTIVKAKRTAGVVLDTDIYAYGPSMLSTRVGERLSQWKLWLQRPSSSRRGVAYENPHFLAVDKIVRRREGR